MAGEWSFHKLRDMTVLIGRIQNRVSLKEKLDQVLNWIDLPLDQRPQLVLGTHLP